MKMRIRSDLRLAVQGAGARSGGDIIEIVRAFETEFKQGPLRRYAQVQDNCSGRTFFGKMLFLVLQKYILNPKP